MSRTKKDGKVHGKPAAGEGQKNRGCGTEWISGRGELKGFQQTGKITKRKTHRAERRIDKRVVKEQVADVAEPQFPTCTADAPCPKGTLSWAAWNHPDLTTPPRGPGFRETARCKHCGRFFPQEDT